MRIELSKKCSNHFTYFDLIQCSDTLQSIEVDNQPRQLSTLQAIQAIAREILDPLKDEFGLITLTRGFSSAALTKAISRVKAPALDQHAGYEVNKLGNQICDRGGMAVDFEGETDSLTLAKYIVSHLPFDRLYFYSENRPVHVSYGPQHSRAIVVMKKKKNGIGLYPRSTSKEQFLDM